MRKSRLRKFSTATQRNTDKRLTESFDKLGVLMDALAEDVATLSDEEILKEASVEEIDVRQEACRIRELLAQAAMLAKRQNR